MSSYIATYIFYVSGVDVLDQVIIVLLSTSMFLGGLLAFILDNTIPGTFVYHIHCVEHHDLIYYYIPSFFFTSNKRDICIHCRQHGGKGHHQMDEPVGWFERGSWDRKCVIQRVRDTIHLEVDPATLLDKLYPNLSYLSRTQGVLSLTMLLQTPNICTRRGK